MYPLASSIHHSCVANATKTVTKEGQLIVRATVPIAKGSRIVLSYSNKPMWGTGKRHFDLEKTRFGRPCRCERCRDPSELGTLVSGIFCFRMSCQGGILLPKDPLNQESDWICNECGGPKELNFIKNLLVKSRMEFDKMDRTAIADCEAFVKKFEVMLYPHHYLVVDRKMILMQLYWHYSGKGQHNLLNGIFKLFPINNFTLE